MTYLLTVIAIALATFILSLCYKFYSTLPEVVRDLGPLAVVWVALLMLAAYVGHIFVLSCLPAGSALLGNYAPATLRQAVGSGVILFGICGLLWFLTFGPLSLYKLYKEWY